MPGIVFASEQLLPDVVPVLLGDLLGELAPPLQDAERQREEAEEADHPGGEEVDAVDGRVPVRIQRHQDVEGREGEPVATARLGQSSGRKAVRISGADAVGGGESELPGPADIADIARNLASNGAGRVPVLGFQADKVRAIPVRPMDDIVTNYYFRFDAMDRPGVLAAIAGILGKYSISLKYVHQKGRKTNGSVPVVMLTHHAREKDVRRALSEISALDVVAGEPMVIRIEDQNGH